MSGFTHFNEDGNAVMVDVGEKAETKREALASGVIRMSEECFQKVKEGSMKKGDVLGVARIAGIMGAKKTAELIPLCHLLNLTKVEIDFEYLEEEGFTVQQVKNIVSRINARITSASIACDMRTPFQKKDTL